MTRLLTVHVDADEARRLKSVLALQDKSISRWLREQVTAYLHEHAAVTPTKKGAKS